MATGRIGGGESSLRRQHTMKSIPQHASSYQNIQSMRKGPVKMPIAGPDAASGTIVTDNYSRVSKLGPAGPPPQSRKQDR